VSNPDKEPGHRSVLVVTVRDSDQGAYPQELPRVEDAAKGTARLPEGMRKNTGALILYFPLLEMGGGAEGDRRYKIRDLLADYRFSQAVLDFLSTTDAGRLVSVEDDARSEASEWELRERRERRGEEGGEGGAT